MKNAILQIFRFNHKYDHVIDNVSDPAVQDLFSSFIAAFGLIVYSDDDGE